MSMTTDTHEPGKLHEAVVKLTKQEQDPRRYIRVDADRWRVETPTAVYFVDTAREPWTCSCTGFRYRRQCRHVEWVKRHAAGVQVKAPADTEKAR